MYLILALYGKQTSMGNRTADPPRDQHSVVSNCYQFDQAIISLITLSLVRSNYIIFHLSYK